MPFKSELKANQRCQVEEVVPGEGKTCDVCGSDDLACEYGAIRNAVFGSVLVRLYCNDWGAHTNGAVGIEQPSFALDDNDAPRIGII